MESQKPKIAMYVKRPFGEKLNASFDFLKENWKLLLKFTTYLLLPLCLIQALSLNGLMSGALSISAIASSTAMAASSSSLIAFGSYYGLYMFLYLIGIILLTSLVYGLIRTYNEREERMLSMIYEKFLGSDLTSEEKMQLNAIDKAMLWYDLTFLLGEKQESEAPELHIDLRYEVRAFGEVEEEYRRIFEEQLITVQNKRI